MNPETELAAKIIGYFDDFLEERGIVIPDPHRENGNPSNAAICGETYYALEDDIASLLKTEIPKIKLKNILRGK